MLHDKDNTYENVKEANAIASAAPIENKVYKFITKGIDRVTGVVDAFTADSLYDFGHEISKYVGGGLGGAGGAIIGTFDSGLPGGIVGTYVGAKLGSDVGSDIYTSTMKYISDKTNEMYNFIKNEYEAKHIY
jgi:hypothetical protein